MTEQEIIHIACKLILRDLRIQELSDTYERKFNYNPYIDVCQLMERSIPDRIKEKDPIQLLRDIHTLRWSEVNDIDWVVIF